MSICDFDILFARYVPNIHEKIFFSLDYESFKSCLEVSKSWNDLLKSESFIKRAETIFCQNIQDEVALAAKQGMVNKIRAVISTFVVDVNFFEDAEGASPLIFAAERGHKDVVQLLLTSGADPNLADEDGFTPLLDAVNDGHFEVAKLLLDYGADPNIANKVDGYVPLMYASESGHEDIVHLLLDRGSDPNIADTMDGSTALKAAVCQNNKHIAKLLLDRGADPDIPDSHGMTPKEYALLNGDKGDEVIALIIESYAMLDQLSDVLSVREE